jgi:hypothetical protein
MADRISISKERAHYHPKLRGTSILKNKIQIKQVQPSSASYNACTFMEKTVSLSLRHTNTQMSTLTHHITLLPHLVRTGLIANISAPHHTSGQDVVLKKIFDVCYQNSLLC